MSEYEKLVPAECRQIVDGAIEHTREVLESKGSIPMVAFVGSFSECSILMLDGARDKQTAANLLAKHVRMMDADFVLHICEMYMLKSTAKSADEAREIEKQAQKVGVMNMPGHVEGVAFQLETGAGHFLGFMEFETANDRKTFGNVELEYLPGYTGRFANLLPKSKK